MRTQKQKDLFRLTVTLLLMGILVIGSINSVIHDKPIFWTIGYITFAFLTFSREIDQFDIKTFTYRQLPRSSSGLSWAKLATMGMLFAVIFFTFGIISDMVLRDATDIAALLRQSLFTASLWLGLMYIFTDVFNQA